MVGEEARYGAVFAVVISFIAGAIAATAVTACLFASFAGEVGSSTVAEMGRSPNIIARTKAYIDCAVENGGAARFVQVDATTSAIVPVCPMTQSERLEFGHMACPQMDVDAFRAQGYVQVGRANYTWTADSVFDLTLLCAMYELSVQDGVYKDSEGYVACYSKANDMFEVVETPLGLGKVYDLGGDWYTIGIFISAEGSDDVS